MSKRRYETRWKTRTLYPDGVAKWLNSKTSAGWSIHGSPIPVYGGRKLLVLLYRNVRTRVTK